ncbi:MAG: site-2 protease family protein [Tissierellia bacterium]|nr:site-2 protease family protein [Tissierellia bacterium]
MNNLADLMWSIPALLISIILHEVAHGAVSYAFGDRTAARDGRLSLNPLRHIDPVGLLFMIVFRFGWAKAVPIRPESFRHRRLGMFCVSMAGVTVNFLLAFFSYPLYLMASSRGWMLQPFFVNLLWYNVMLMVFNLLPIPPLDGSKVLASFFPWEVQEEIFRYERYSYFILVGLVVTGILSQIIGPIISVVLTGISTFWSGVLL